jgi:hypothetical protein
MSESQAKYSDELIEKYRDVNVDYSWWDSTEEDFKDRMNAIGVFVDKMYFSGFWSQGDGACFTGSITGSGWKDYLPHLGYDNPVLTETADWNWGVKISHHDRYYHEYSVTIDCDIFLPDNPYDEEEDPLRHAAWAGVMHQFDLLGLEEKIIENLRDHMRDLYKTLEQEHDYLTSDEVVIEWMTANDIDPNELNDED